jgi:hypothetical protein
VTRTLFTYGHNSAAGANGVAACAFFPPFVPETNRRLRHPPERHHATGSTVRDRQQHGGADCCRRDGRVPDQCRPARGGRPVHLLGQTVRIPEGTIASGGAEFFGNFSGGVPFQGRFLQADRQGLQPARRLRLRQCREGGGRRLEEQAQVDRFVSPSKKGPRRPPARALPFVVQCARLAILSFYLFGCRSRHCAVSGRLK